MKQRVGLAFAALAALFILGPAEAQQTSTSVDECTHMGFYKLTEQGATWDTVDGADTAPFGGKQAVATDTVIEILVENKDPALLVYVWIGDPTGVAVTNGYPIPIGEWRRFKPGKLMGAKKIGLGGVAGGTNAVATLCFRRGS